MLFKKFKIEIVDPEGLNLLYKGEVRALGIRIISKDDIEIESAHCDVVDDNNNIIESLECIVNNVDKEVFIYLNTENYHTGKHYNIKYKLGFHNNMVSIFKINFKVEK